MVEQILDQTLAPGWRSSRPATGDPKWTWLREQASRGRAQLERSAEIAEKLGDNAPRMNAGALHAWAWESGAPYWRNGHFHQAVMEASKRVNFETKQKLGRRDVGEVVLFQQAFSTDPPRAGQPRLRVVPDDGGDTFKNVHRGARSLGEALYSGIRNPGMHELSAPQEEHVALEQLAAFSILARWVDGASIESVD